MREIWARLARGLPQILGLAALGLAIAAIIYLAASPFTTATTSMRVTFAFNGFERGEYPDHSKFQPDDLRASDVVVEALKRDGLNADEEFQGKIRAAITIEGIIPPNVTKARDRLRAAGQNPPTYVPDEYLLTLTLPRKFPLDSRQRARLLNEIVGVFQAKFQRTHAALPLAFGNVQETLRDADYSDYERVLSSELENIEAYLSQQIVDARSFRSPTTNRSFSDLLEETQLFSRVQLNETLGLIRLYSLSRDRKAALVKMDYTLKTLADEERLALEEEKTDREYLAMAEEHSRTENFVVGVKSQVTQPRPDAPILDQGLVNSLLANDSYNLVIRKALDASLKVKRIQAEEARILERRKEMDAAMREDNPDQSTLMKRVDASLKVLQTAYDRLVSEIRQTQTDYAHQQFGSAIRISMAPITGSKYRPLAKAGIIGAFLGLALGMGLSLLGVYVGAAKKAA
ncbi:MAG: hypothetical protein PHE83_02130 [Opitutaceae bacterium]|nr:hypothetical protein [Opitutaceae bacterium]